MKRTIFTTALLVLLFGCINTPVAPKSRGCQSYCFPVLTNLLLSLSRSNSITHETDSWHGGVMQWMAGDIVTVRYDRAICTNGPQNAVTFAWFCSNNLQSVTKQLPSNSYDCDYNATNNCQDCSFSVTYLQAALCGQEQGPLARTQSVFDNGEWVIVKSRK